MSRLKYQLVIQFPASTDAEFDSLLELEDALEDELAEIDDTVVEGNDFGTGEFNLFLDTDRPQEIFELIHEFIQAERPGLTCAAGYRLVKDKGYTALWPVGSTFKVA